MKTTVTTKDQKACMRWWIRNNEGGKFCPEDLPIEVVTFGLWKGLFKKVNNKIIVPKLLN